MLFEKSKFYKSSSIVNRFRVELNVRGNQSREREKKLDRATKNCKVDLTFKKLRSSSLKRMREIGETAITRRIRAVYRKSAQRRCNLI